MQRTLGIEPEFLGRAVSTQLQSHLFSLRDVLCQVVTQHDLLLPAWLGSWDPGEGMKKGQIPRHVCRKAGVLWGVCCLMELHLLMLATRNTQGRG